MAVDAVLHVKVILSDVTDADNVGRVRGQQDARGKADLERICTMFGTTFNGFSRRASEHFGRTFCLHSQMCGRTDAAPLTA